MRTTLLLAVVATLVIPDLARAQIPAREHRSATDSPLNSQALSVAQGQPMGARQARDPLWNGLINGAAVGALLGGIMGRTVELNNRHSGQGATVNGALIGAGLGAGIGAGVDALFSRSFRRPQKVTVSPILSRELKAITTQVRF